MARVLQVYGELSIGKWFYDKKSAFIAELVLLVFAIGFSMLLAKTAAIGIMHSVVVAWLLCCLLYCGVHIMSFMKSRRLAITACHAAWRLRFMFCAGSFVQFFLSGVVAALVFIINEALPFALVLGTALSASCRLISTGVIFALIASARIISQPYFRLSYDAILKGLEASDLAYCRKRWALLCLHSCGVGLMCGVLLFMLRQPMSSHFHVKGDTECNNVPIKRNMFLCAFAIFLEFPQRYVINALQL